MLFQLTSLSINIKLEFTKQIREFYFANKVF